MPYTLPSRNILITGGSRGLGAATARCFAAEGCNIAINYLSSSGAAASLVSDLSAQYPSQRFVSLQADVGLSADCARLVASAVSALGGLDIIVSNAGWTRIMTSFGDIAGVTDDDWSRTHAVNVVAHARLLTAALLTFQANERGGSLLITAVTNHSGSNVAYAVSKAGALHLMRCLAGTQGPKVRVNAVLPGLLEKEWGMELPETVREARRERCALKMLPTVEDCAEAFVFLAKSETVTRAAVKVDGGYRMYSVYPDKSHEQASATVSESKRKGGRVRLQRGRNQK